MSALPRTGRGRQADAPAGRLAAAVTGRSRYLQLSEVAHTPNEAAGNTGPVGPRRDLLGVTG